MHKYFFGCCAIATVVTHMVCKIFRQNNASWKFSLTGHSQNIHLVKFVCIWYKVWALLPSNPWCSSWLLSFLYLLIVDSEGTLSCVQTLSFTSFSRICRALNAGSYCCICLITSGEVCLPPDLARAGVGCDPLVSGVPVQTEWGNRAQLWLQSEWLHMSKMRYTKLYHHSYKNWE